VSLVRCVVEDLNMNARSYDMFNDIPYCNEHCPYLEDDAVEGYCHLLKKELSFYDWFIAECDTEKPAED
jgi:hypothetical protein